VVQVAIPVLPATSWFSFLAATQETALHTLIHFDPTVCCDRQGKMLELSFFRRPIIKKAALFEPFALSWQAHRHTNRSYWNFFFTEPFACRNYLSIFACVDERQVRRSKSKPLVLSARARMSGRRFPGLQDTSQRCPGFAGSHLCNIARYGDFHALVFCNSSSQFSQFFWFLV